MKNAEKIAQKIAALKAEMKQIKKQEKRQAVAQAQQEFDRALKASGLLALVSQGTLSPERLEAEFRAVAARAKQTKSVATKSTTETLPDTKSGLESHAVQDTKPQDQKEGGKSFWSR